MTAPNATNDCYFVKPESTKFRRIQTRLSRWLPHVLLIGVHLVLFGSMVSGHRAPGFRDSAFLYYPLFKWIDRQTEADELPLWNPYDNFGAPVVEDTTTSLFYPGKVLFCWRSLPYPSRFGIYLMLHSLLAAYGAYWCALRLRCNRYGATLAALSYSLGGAILFQVCNVIFLIGAAWLPWSLGCWWLLFSDRKSNVIPWCALTLAMMVLGGDPQMAYHSALIGLFLMLLVSFSRSNGHTPKRRRLFENGIRYVIVGFFAVGLCAIQLLPSASFSKYSARTRHVGEPARSIYELLENPQSPLIGAEEESNLESGPATNFFRAPDPETHHSDIYDFSQPPWSFTQLIWPNNTGKWMPELRRWTMFLPNVPKIWTPSIYLGILPIVFALSGLRFWGSNRRNVWLSWVALFFTLGSLGVYGFVWLIQFIGAGFLGREFLEDTHGAAGGIYWLMVVGLPKYVVFRYPAKLFVVAALGLSLLAGRQFNPRQMLNGRMICWLTTTVIAASVFAIFYVLAPSFGFYDQVLSRMGNHVTLGPFDADGCVSDILTGLFSTIFILLFFAFSLWLVRSKKVSLHQAFFALTIVTCFELVLANGWLVLTVSSNVMEQPTEYDSKYQEFITRAKNEKSPFGRILRMERDEGIPERFSSESSLERLEEIMMWQRESLFPKFHLDNDVPLVGSFSSVEFANYEEIKQQRAPTGVAAICHSVKSAHDWEIVEYKEKAAAWVKTNPDMNGYRFVEFSNNRIVIEFDQMPETIVMETAWSPGWHARWENGDEIAGSKIIPDKNAMLKLSTKDSTNQLPARLILTYRPRYYSLGKWLTIASSAIFAIFVVVSGFRKLLNRKVR